MTKPGLMCRTATTFSASGALDAQALREFLQRFVDADIGVYLASGGSGEGHALTFGSLNTLALGAAGLLVAEANILPRTYRRYVDLYAAGNFEGLARVYVELKRFGRYVSQWNPSNPRWIKMAMRAFRLPEGAGGVREPYCMPEASEIARFVDGLLRLRLPEIDEMARAAGLSIPGAAAA